MCEHCSRLGSGFPEALGEWDPGGPVLEYTQDRSLPIRMYGPRRLDGDYMPDGLEAGFADGDGYADEGWDEVDYEDDGAFLTEGLRSALHEDYEHLPAQYVQDALLNVFGEVTPAESASLGSALHQIGRAAAQAAEDPLVGQIAAAGLPVAGGAAGTYFLGAGTGTSVGTALGSAVAKSLPTRRSGTGKAPPKAPEPASRQPVSASPEGPPVLGGSPAAAQALCLTQSPAMLKCLMALALGEYGRPSCDGVSVGAAMNLLSKCFAQAAVDADKLAFARSKTPGYLQGANGNPQGDPASPGDRAQALYRAVVAEPSASATRAGTA
jgi:hypothetical protein